MKCVSHTLACQCIDVVFEDWTCSVLPNFARTYFIANHIVQKLHRKQADLEKETRDESLVLRRRQDMHK